MSRLREPSSPQSRFPRPIRGRGTRDAPPVRFESQALEIDLEALRQGREAGEEEPDPRTRYLADASRSALSTNDSPDIGFDVGINPYRGCEHGCVYCYARPTHEFLGYSSGLDFETVIFVKHELPALLRRALVAPGWRPQVIGMCGVTDPYQPIERQLRLTRRCLEVLAELRNPVSIITKSRGITRDIDLLGELALHDSVSASLSITSLDAGLARLLEPRASQPGARLAAMRALAGAGVPVGVSVAPVIPGLNDHEIPAILEAAAGAGAGFASFQMLRLPYSVKDLFAGWLDDHFPLRRERVLRLVRESRGGRLDDPRFGSRMRGTGPYAEQIRGVFRLARDRAGLAGSGPELSASAFRRATGTQLDLL